MLGQNLIKNLVPDKPIDTPLPDVLDGLIDSAADIATDAANDIANNIAEKIADELGIHDWYSLHVQDMCFGTFKPNATAKGASKNGTRCTKDVAMSMSTQSCEISKLTVF